MKPPKAFHDLCNGLHQDATIFAEVSLERLASYCLGFVRDEFKPELSAFIGRILLEMTPTEINRLIKKDRPDTLFSGSSAKAFLHAVVEAMRPKYSGMSVNERLFVAGLLADWDQAVRAGNRAGMIEILGRVDLGDGAGATADSVLANPAFYGF